MSIRVLSSVWQNSRSKNGARLVLLALADFADDGGGAYPSIAALTKKTLLSERAVQSGLKELVSLKELEIKANEARCGCNYYIIRVPPAESAPPQNLHPAVIAPVQILPNTPAESAPEPSVEPSIQISEAKASSPVGTGKKVKVEKNPALLVEVTEMFHRLCPTLPRIKKIEGARLTCVRQRWRSCGENPLAWFEELFRTAGESERVSTGAWCSFDWLMKPVNAQKVLEGNYNNDRQKPSQQNGTHQQSSGRSNARPGYNRNEGTFNAGSTSDYSRVGRLKIPDPVPDAQRPAVGGDETGGGNVPA